MSCLLAEDVADGDIFSLSISNTTDHGPVVNKIAKALVERILEAAHGGYNFKVCRLPVLLHRRG